MSHRTVTIALVGFLLLGAAACGTDAGAETVPTTPPDDAAACPVDDPDCYETGAESDGPSSGMCAPDVTDCVDTVVDPAGAACPVDDPNCYETGAETDGPSMGMCAPGVTDCVDTVVDPAGAACPVDDPDCYETGAESDGARCLPDAVGCDDTSGGAPAPNEVAVGLLGVAEDQVPADVRVARRGTEVFALTEDHVLGRVTVDLDDVDGSGYRVVTATVEVPEGVAIYELTPG